MLEIVCRYFLLIFDLLVIISDFVTSEAVKSIFFFAFYKYLCDWLLHVIEK